MSVPATITLPYKYTFNTAGHLEETGNPDNSTSPYWWVSSGGFLDLALGYGQTNQGALLAGSKWQLAYAKANPTDTDGGLHPQNIFRLVDRAQFQDVTESVYFKINKLNLSDSPNRNASNGLFLMSRYVDQDNLYYIGLRVDGYAVIKKKVAGVYTTLAYVRVFPGAYDRQSNPNLLPVGQWVGLRAWTFTYPGHVTLQLATDVGRTGVWKTRVIIEDAEMGLEKAGRHGIRTDFMDVQFDDYSLS